MTGHGPVIQNPESSTSGMVQYASVAEANLDEQDRANPNLDSDQLSDDSLDRGSGKVP